MPNNNNSKLLADKIPLLIQNGGTLILLIGDYFVQFVKNKKSKEVHFEAVSHYFLDLLPTNLTVDFSRLGFELIEGENYSKMIKNEDWKTIISDVENIFTHIYKVNYEKPFEVIDDIEYNNKTNVSYSSNETEQLIQTTLSEQRPNWTAIFLILGVVIFFYFAFFKEKGLNNNQNTYQENYLEKSPETQLAIINDYTKTPTERSITLFTELLTSLNTRYTNTTKQQIANALVAAHNMVINSGQTESLLEFSTAFNSYSKEIDPSFRLKLEESLTLFLKFVYQL